MRVARVRSVRTSNTIAQRRMLNIYMVFSVGQSESESDMSEDEQTSKRQLVAQSQPASMHDDTEEDEDEMTGGLDFTQTDYADQMTQIDASTQDKDETAAAKFKSNAMSTRVGQMAPKVIEELTALLVRYMLYKASLKLPIKFGDISKDVFPKYKNVSRYVQTSFSPPARHSC